jgi:hypothetical protein
MWIKKCHYKGRKGIWQMPALTMALHIIIIQTGGRALAQATEPTQKNKRENALP